MQDSMQRKIFSILIPATKSPLYIIDSNLKFILLACPDDADDHHHQIGRMTGGALPQNLVHFCFCFCLLYVLLVRPLDVFIALMGNERCRSSIVDFIKYLWIKWKIIGQISPTMWWRAVMEHSLIAGETRVNNFNWNVQCCRKCEWCGDWVIGHYGINYVDPCYILSVKCHDGFQQRTTKAI